MPQFDLRQLVFYLDKKISGISAVCLDIFGADD
jgi:hypothetical protein